MSDKLKIGFLSLFGLGRNKKAPGTLGSFAALVCVILIKNFFNFHPVLLLPAILFFAAFLYYLSHSFIKGAVREGEYDQQWIVMDEFIGMLIAGLPFLATNPPKGWLLIFGFLLFRFFDILKPWPVKRADQLNSPHGVLLDDVLAGTAADLILIIALLAI